MRRLRAALACLGALAALTGCWVGDPVGHPVAHQIDGDDLVLLFPLCPQELVESVLIEDVEAAAEQTTLYERQVSDPQANEIRIDLREVPRLAAARGALVTVVTNQVRLGSALDLPEVPDASTMSYRLTDKIVSRQQVLSQDDCEPGG